MTDMTYDEWYDAFEPDQVHYVSAPDDLDYHFIWTAVEGDDGEVYMSEGIRKVNALWYEVTLIPWEDENAPYTVFDDFISDEVQ